MGCYNSCVVNAPIDRVWSVLRDFYSLPWAPEVVQNVARTGSAAGDQIGARRVLNGVFHETLLALNDVDRELLYSIDDGPGAVSRQNVSGYIGKVRLRPITDDGGTFVEWSSSWQDSHGGVKELCDPVYKALLASLKKYVEAATV